MRNKRDAAWGGMRYYKMSSRARTQSSRGRSSLSRPTYLPQIVITPVGRCCLWSAAIAAAVVTKVGDAAMHMHMCVLHDGAGLPSECSVPEMREGT